MDCVPSGEDTFPRIVSRKPCLRGKRIPPHIDGAKAPVLDERKIHGQERALSPGWGQRYVNITAYDESSWLIFLLFVGLMDVSKGEEQRAVSHCPPP